MIRLELNDEEAILLDALSKYASALLKPPLHATHSHLQGIRSAAEAIVATAPAEVMQRLAWKLYPAFEPAMRVRKAILEKWNRARI
jgi:hypothetical protein